jgi:transposase
VAKHLTQDERDEILRLHYEEGLSTRYLAETYSISRSAIQNWLRADRRKRAQQRLAGRKKGSSKEADRLIRELKMYVEVMQTFLQELERWDAPE